MIRAYHFVGQTLRDGRRVPRNGAWLEHDGPLQLCVSGLHASRHPFDALMYAPGPILCVVDLDGEMIEAADKLVARRRRIVARVDATEVLRSFARACASDVLHLWTHPPDVVWQYLETGDETIRAAAWAASDAAWAASDAAWAAAKNAARAAAWAAAKNAASAAAWAADDAAWAAAKNAARDAARAASWAAAAAAWAARDAARAAGTFRRPPRDHRARRSDAARAAQGARWQAMVDTLFAGVA